MIGCYYIQISKLLLADILYQFTLWFNVLCKPGLYFMFVLQTRIGTCFKKSSCPPWWAIKYNLSQPRETNYNVTNLLIGVLEDSRR